jgi:hypothetical protein
MTGASPAFSTWMLRMSLAAPRASAMDTRPCVSPPLVILKVRFHYQFLLIFWLLISAKMSVAIESMFVRGQERWTARDASSQSTSLSYNALTQSVAVSSPGNVPVYFVAPGILFTQTKKKDRWKKMNFVWLQIDFWATCERVTTGTWFSGCELEMMARLRPLRMWCSRETASELCKPFSAKATSYLRFLYVFYPTYFIN